MGGAHPAPVQAVWKGGVSRCCQTGEYVCWERLSQQLNSWSRKTLNCKQKYVPVFGIAARSSDLWGTGPADGVCLSWSFLRWSRIPGCCPLPLTLQAHFEGVDLLSVFLLMSFIYSELWKTSEGTWAFLDFRSMEIGFETIFWCMSPVLWLRWKTQFASNQNLS